MNNKKNNKLKNIPKQKYAQVICIEYQKDALPAQFVEDDLDSETLIGFVLSSDLETGTIMVFWQPVPVPQEDLECILDEKISTPVFFKLLESAIHANPNMANAWTEILKTYFGIIEDCPAEVSGVDFDKDDEMEGVH